MMKRFFIALFFLVSLAVPGLSTVRAEASPIISIHLGRPYRTAYYPERVYRRERPPVYIGRTHCHNWNCDNRRGRRWHGRDHNRHYDREHDHGRYHEDRDR